MAIDFNLRVSGNGKVSLWSENGTKPLLEWDANVDSPHFEQQIDGASIRIGFKRFLINESHSKDAIDEWFANVHPAPPVAQPQRDSATVAADISRLTAMFEAGNLTAEEFSLLVAKAAQPSGTETQKDIAQDRELHDLHARADLAEFQSLWLAVFKNNMPTALDQNALYNRLLGLRNELDRLPRELIALTNLVAEQNNLNFLAKGQIANEIARAIKKNKPLPPLATQSISRLRGEMNSLTVPIRQFAKRMGWRDMPMF